MMDFVSWEDEIPNWMENKNMLQTNDQLRIANIGPRALNFEPWSKRGTASAGQAHERTKHDKTTS